MTLNRREFLGAVTAAGALAWLGRAPKATAAAQRPNLLVVVSDQQHYQAAGFADPFFQTPTLDGLAKESALFTSAFCSTPACSPSRASLYTGFHPHRTKVVSNLDAPGLDGRPIRALPREIPTVFDALRAAGYHVGYFGKWHLGDWEHRRARLDAGTVVQPTFDDGSTDLSTTADATRYLHARLNRQQPFALFVNYVNPHDIYDFGDGVGLPTATAPLPASFRQDDLHDKPDLQARYSSHLPPVAQLGKWMAFRAFYRDKVRLYDTELGRLLGTLQKLGLDESTALFVTSDHGEMDTHHRLMFKGPFMYENVMRVPLLVRLPPRFGGVGARRIDAAAIGVDLAPTLIELAGGAPAQPLDGTSWMALLRGETPTTRPFVVGQFHSKLDWIMPIRMIRTPQWKYNLYRSGSEELYHLSEDADECVNLAVHPAAASTRGELRSSLERWIVAAHDPFFSLEMSHK